jgi:hypothetical protein
LYLAVIKRLQLPIAVAAILVFSICGNTNLQAQSTATLSAPAEFLRYLTPPGTQNGFLRPTRIFTDPKFDEVYVADPGHNRITIFDKNGTFKFDFPVGARCGAPLDMAVNSQGIIYVLGSAPEGRQVMTFDYDGLFLGRFEDNPDAWTDSLNIVSIAIDNQDRLYLLDQYHLQIIRFGSDGRLDLQIPLGNGLDAPDKDELILGSLSISNSGTIYLPLASLGTVYRYDGSGRPLQPIGYKGNDLGELNFPISVAETDDGIIMVLDKHRYNVICFDLSGRFLGEFGGKGSSPGWFYHPTWLAVDELDHIYIGQVYLNRVQVCALPDFIRDRQKQVNSPESDSLKSSTSIFDSANPNLKSMRALHVSYSSLMRVPTFTSINLQDNYLLSTHLQPALWRFRNA